jgi:hypothetical protein
MTLYRTLVVYSIRAAKIALPIAAGALLAREMALLPALLWSALLSAALPALGVLLLSRTRTQEISWKNYAAGYLMPWGYTLGRGKLPAISVVCGCCWLFLFALGIAAARIELAPSEAEPSAEAPALARWLLVGGWLVDGMALLYCLGVLRQNFGGSSQGGAALRKAIAFVLGLIVFSALAAWLGHVRTAALIAAGPALALGAFYALWIGLILTVGRNARWN